MNIKIDPTIKLEFPGREAVIDAFDFNDFLDSLFTEKGVEVKNEADGTTKKELPFDLLIDEIVVWIQANAGIAVKKHEARYLYKNWPAAFKKKREALETPDSDMPGSSSSTPDTLPDPRYAD